MTNSDAFILAALFEAAAPQTASFLQCLLCALASVGFMLPPSLSFLGADLQAGSVLHSPLCT
jgi:hypothetical protein